MARTTRDQNDEDDEHTPTDQQEEDDFPPPVATPEDDDDAHEAAAAAAEVAAMGRGRRGRDTTADEALMGAVGGDEGVGSFELLDESGELVRQAFLQFLSE